MTLAMMIELESTGIKVNLVSPTHTKTNLNGYAGKESVEDGSREAVRVALARKVRQVHSRVGKT
jgi:NAD(P)-dependent dehydrogenase (short-subunit alcohol dehydrogenase family)